MSPRNRPIDRSTLNKATQALVAASAAAAASMRDQAGERLGSVLTAEFVAIL